MIVDVVNVDVVSPATPQYLKGGGLERFGAHPHPYDEAAVLELRLDMRGVPLRKPDRQARPNEEPDAAARHGGDRGRDRRACDARRDPEGAGRGR